jgi:pimeloyl-ACP methyl ester carboxylesterase
LDEADEILIVGHSVGTQIAVAAVARALARLGNRDIRLSLLTLGHTIPLEALHPTAQRFRAEIMAVAGDRRVTWIDVSAAIDSACFPLCDPLQASGLAQPDPSDPKPKIVSARFPKLFRPESYAVLRREFRRAHFQYLLSAELPGDYDYFLITAGYLTLHDRFAHLTSVTNFNRFRLGKS